MAAIVADVTGTAPEVSHETGLVTAPASNPALLPAVVRRMDEAALMAAELAFRLPSLDEVFLTLTGHPAEDSAGSGGSVARAMEGSVAWGGAGALRVRCQWGDGFRCGEKGRGGGRAGALPLSPRRPWRGRDPRAPSAGYQGSTPSPSPSPPVVHT